MSDTTTTTQTGGNKRPAPRKLKAGSKVILEMLSGLSSGPELVCPMEISDSSMSFEYTRFVYPGNACSVVLKTPTRSFVRLRGSVWKCDCVARNTFHVTLRFESRLDLDAVLGKVADTP